MLSLLECITWLTLALTLSVATVILNALTITVFRRHRNLRNRGAYLLINLAVADMLVGGISTLDQFCTLGENCDIWKYRWSAKFFALKMAFVFLFVVSSLTNITAISIEKFHATFWPFRHRVLKVWIYKLIIAVVWILAGLISLTNIVLIHFRRLLEYFYFWNSFNAVCLLVICASYASVFFKVHYGSQPLHRDAANRDRKLTVTLFIVTSVSLLLWLPYVVTRFLLFENFYFVSLPEFMYFRLEYVFVLLFHANSLVNPILYVAKMPRFRRAFLSLFTKRPQQRRQVRVYPLHDI